MPRRIKIAEIQDIAPGRGKLVEIEGQQVALFNLGGTFYAIEATCPHRGGPLQDGDLEGDRVICPLHDYDFSLKTGESSAAPDLRVATFSVVVEGPHIFIELP